MEKKHKHPVQEAAAAEAHLRRHAAHAFDEFIVLRLRASNEPPFPFAWVDETATKMDYGAALARISQAF